MSLMLGIGLGLGGRAGGSATFDPATLTLSGWWRANFGGSPWAGTASAGGSGSRSLTEATFPPSAGAAVNSLTPADFDGTNDNMSAGIAASTLLTTTAYSYATLIYIDTVAAYGTDEYDNEAIWSTISGSTSAGLCVSSNGLSAYHYAGASNWPGVTVACATGGWHLCQVKYDGTNLKMRIDSGAWSSAAAGTAQGFVDLVWVGTDYTGTKYFDGKMLELMFAQSALSDANFDNIKSYVNARYGLAL